MANKILSRFEKAQKVRIRKLRKNVFLRKSIRRCFRRGHKNVQRFYSSFLYLVVVVVVVVAVVAVIDESWNLIKVR